jgi:hypothetical protein
MRERSTAALRDLGPIGRYIAATRRHMSASELAAACLPPPLERELWHEIRQAIDEQERRR